MRKSGIGLLVLLSLAQAQAIKAQTADEVVDKYITAMGGKENLLSLKSVKMTGSINTEGIEVGITITTVHGVGSRNDISVPGMGEGYQVMNATKGWDFLPFQGQASPEEASEEKVKSSRHLLDLQGLLVNYKEKGSQVELVGKEKVDSAECFKLKITTMDGNIFTQFIDSNTGYRVKTIVKTITPGGEENTETTFSDFKKNSDGYVFPYAQTISRGTIIYTSIETNIPVDENIFTIK